MQRNHNTNSGHIHLFNGSTTSTALLLFMSKQSEERLRCLLVKHQTCLFSIRRFIETEQSVRMENNNESLIISKWPLVSYVTFFSGFLSAHASNIRNEPNKDKTKINQSTAESLSSASREKQFSSLFFQLLLWTTNEVILQTKNKEAFSRLERENRTLCLWDCLSVYRQTYRMPGLCFISELSSWAEEEEDARYRCQQAVSGPERVYTVSRGCV